MLAYLVARPRACLSSMELEINGWPLSRCGRLFFSFSQALLPTPRQSSSPYLLFIRVANGPGSLANTSGLVLYDGLKADTILYLFYR